MKTSTLIDILQKSLQEHGDLEVRASWESITPEIDSIYIGNERSGAPKAVLLDLDGSFYQDRYAEAVLWQRDEG